MLFLGGGLRKAAPLLGIESLNVLYFPNSEATPKREALGEGGNWRTVGRPSGRVFGLWAGQLSPERVLCSLRMRNFRGCVGLILTSFSQFRSHPHRRLPHVGTQCFKFLFG